MLSFDSYYPANNCFNSADPFESVFCQPASRRSPNVRVRYATPQTQHQQIPTFRNASLFDLLDLVNAGYQTSGRPQRHQYPVATRGRSHGHTHNHHHPHDQHIQHQRHQVQPKKVETKKVEPKLKVETSGSQTDSSYNIRIFKNIKPEDFQDYSILYEVKDETLLIIESKTDSFKKVYSFDNGSINLEGVTWKSSKDGLSINIPKVIVKQAIKQAPIVRPSQPLAKPVAEKQAKKSIPIESPKRQRSSDSPRPRVISIPIEFGEQSHFYIPLSRSTANSSEASTPVQSDTEDELSTPSATDSEISEAEEENVKQFPKLTKKVSIEEVEDESFIQMDLD